LSFQTNNLFTWKKISNILFFFTIVFRNNWRIDPDQANERKQIRVTKNEKLLQTTSPILAALIKIFAFIGAVVYSYLFTFIISHARCKQFCYIINIVRRLVINLMQETANNY